MKKKNIIINILKAIFIFLLFDYSWLFQLIPVFLFDLSDAEIASGQWNVILSAFSSCALAIILFFLYRNDLKEEFKKFKNNFSSNLDKGLKYWCYGLIGMAVSNFLIGWLFSNGQANNEETVQSMISALPWLMLINAGVIAPIVEELVFRKSLKDVFSNKWLFIGISGLLFGLAHVVGNVEIWTDWLFIIPYGSLGAAFAAAYYDSDTVFTPIMIHMMHNIVLVLLSIF